MPQQALTYVNDGLPGWQRVRRGRGFSYHDAEGQRIADRQHLARIRALAIPPAYTDVWICPDPAGHLQATGRDARGRKQYRYHPLWQARRKQANFDRMLDFGRHLPAMRRAVARDLRRRKPGLEAVVATVVRLLDLTALRIGNEQYSAHNGSYGLSTLRGRHARAQGGEVQLSFKGKSGVAHQVRVEDPAVARLVRRCQELPGQRLFQFVDEQGQVHHLRSDHVNEYLRSISGQDFTAKDFRTWHASVCAMELALQAVACGEGHASDAVQMVRQVARRLGNTSAVCRKFYIHPDVLRCCEQPHDGKVARPARPRAGLSPAECALMALLARERHAR